MAPPTISAPDAKTTNLRKTGLPRLNTVEVDVSTIGFSTIAACFPICRKRL